MLKELVSRVVAAKLHIVEKERYDLIVGESKSIECLQEHYVLKYFDDVLPAEYFIALVDYKKNSITLCAHAKTQHELINKFKEWQGSIGTCYCSYFNFE